MKMIQLTNGSIGAIAIDAYIPMGTITRRIDCSPNAATFVTGNSTADTITITDDGYYNITYSLTAVADAAGVANTSLVINGTPVYTVGTTTTAGGTYTITLPYVVRVFRRCDNMATNNPMTVQVTTDAAITSGTSNIIVEKIY